jgi:L-alanine-DL-glutamate epimerase-like enolase superfamily enzyme
MERRTLVRSIAAGGAMILSGLRSKGRFALAGQLQTEGSLDGSAARELSRHRIAKIEAWESLDRYPRFVGRNSRGKPAGRGFERQIRIVTTDKGIRGGAMSGVSDEQFRKLIGAPVSDLFDLEHGTAEEAYSIDQVLHDLVGQILEKPVYALMGANGPRQVPIYSGAIYFDDLEPPEKPRGIAGVLASCKQDYDAGYRAFKLKIGQGFKWMPHEEGIRRDVEVTCAVRERFPDCKILVDANNGYTCDDFLGYVTAVKDCDLYCIEEPFAENRDELQKLRDHMAKVGCRALIMEGESRTEAADPPWRYGWYSRRHIETLFALAREKLVDVLNLDLAIVGFTRWRHIMPELAQAGLLASPHTWAGTPRPYYSAHLAAGVGNVLILEGIPGAATGMDYSAYKFVDGKLVVPDDPGFGLKLSFGA